jgi:hypothetical protein
MNELSDEVHLYLDVLVSLTFNQFFGKLDETLIVIPESCRMLLLESKL